MSDLTNEQLFLEHLSSTLSVADDLTDSFNHFSLHFKHSSGRMLHQVLRSPDDLPLRLIPGWDSYICPQPHQATGKPSLSDIPHVYWAVLDIDPLPGGGQDYPNVFDDVADFFYTLKGLPRKWPTIVLTGRGAQIWLPISPSHPSILRDLQYTLNQLEIFEFLNTRGWAVDPTCFEASHIFRLPGTINSRTGTTAIVWQTPEDYCPVALSDYVEKAPPPPSLAPRAAGQPLGTGAILTACSPQARDFLAWGAAAPQSRHRQAFIACAQLQELGVPLDTARPLVASAAACCKPPLTDWEDILVRTYARKNAESA